MSKDIDKKEGCREQRRSMMTTAFFEHRLFLQRFLRRFFSDPHDIDDVTQEAFLRAYVAEQQQDINQCKAYLFRTAKNIALNRLTAKSAQIVDYIEECGASVVLEINEAADIEAEAEEHVGLYCEAVAALPEKCREVFLLRKVHGLAYKDIAERMSLSVNSIEKYMLRGVLACQDYVDRREGRIPSSSMGTQRRKDRCQQDES